VQLQDKENLGKPESGASKKKDARQEAFPGGKKGAAEGFKKRRIEEAGFKRGK